jgi:uncharacterized membrane protein
MKKSMIVKGASALSALIAVLFFSSAVAQFIEDATLAWFPLVMALAWCIIAGLFYQRARRIHQGNKEP